MKPSLPGSIRLRITAVAAFAAAVVLTATALVVLTVQRGQLIENLDSSLEQRADAIRGGLAAGEVGVFAVSEDADRFVQVVGPDGVTASSPNVAGLPPAIDPGAATGAVTVSDFALEDDSFRVLVTPAEGDTLLVGENIDDVNDAMRNLTVTFSAAVPTVVAILAVLTWWLVGRTLEPVSQIRREVTEIRAGALDRRVHRPTTDDEIADLVETVNEMLDRVEEATKRQEAFIADASHELKSPLARMRTELEVDNAQRGDVDPLLSSALEEVRGLQGLVEDLLHLATSDAAALKPRRSVPVDIDDIVLREAQILRDSTSHHVDTSGVSAAHVLGDPVELLRAVRNLVENAGRHARSQVSFTVGEHADDIRFEIADDGQGVPEGQLDRVFDRFSRLDESRTTSRGGTGLGLAIVRDIVERHDGRVWAEPRHPVGLRIVVTLPAAQPA